MSYDIIGDIHGQATKLETLLEKLGYRLTQSSYCHADRTAIFIGDFIDRGKENARTIDIVRRMIDAGQAQAVLANHEYNAICYHTRDPQHGMPLRAHTESKTQQHKTFLDEFPLEQRRTKEIIDWFKTLPLFVETPEFRVIHASWCDRALGSVRASLNKDNTLSDDLILSSSNRDSDQYWAIERLLKGPEVQLPHGTLLTDKSGHQRDTVRVKWWPHDGERLPDFSLMNLGDLRYVPDVPMSQPDDVSLYPPDERPVFFGHYSLSPEQGALQACNAVCVDFSAHPDYRISAYRWTSGDVLTENAIVQV